METGALFLGGTKHKKVLKVDYDIDKGFPNMWQIPIFNSSDVDLTADSPDCNATFEVQTYIARRIVEGLHTSTVFVLDGDDSILNGYIHELNKNG